jgi:hypothetical protein
MYFIRAVKSFTVPPSRNVAQTTAPLLVAIRLLTHSPEARSKYAACIRSEIV